MPGGENRRRYGRGVIDSLKRFAALEKKKVVVSDKKENTENGECIGFFSRVLPVWFFGVYYADRPGGADLVGLVSDIFYSCHMSVDDYDGGGFS